jgi:hypothetical protein
VWLREIEGKNKNLWAIFEGKNLPLPLISPPPIALFEFSSLYVVDFGGFGKNNRLGNHLMSMWFVDFGGGP